MASLYQMAKKIGLSFADVEHLDFESLSMLKKDEWSNSWQSNFIDLSKKLRSSISSMEDAFSNLVEVLGTTSLQASTASLVELNDIAKVLLDQATKPIRFVFSSDAKESIESLESLSELKINLETLLLQCKLSFNIEDASSLDVSQWIVDFNVAESKSWPFKWFAHRKLKKVIFAKNVDGELSADELNTLANISKLCLSIKKLTPLFEKEKIWQGWETSSESIQEVLESAKHNYTITRKFAGKLDDPAALIASLNHSVVENHEFFISSKLFNSCETFTKNLPEFMSLNTEYKTLGGEIDENVTLQDYSQYLSKIEDSSPKLKSWCEWIQAKREAHEHGLSELIKALEQRLIKPTETEQLTQNALHIWMTPILIDNSEVLRKFKTSTHEDLINQFRELDAIVANTTAEYIASVAASLSPDPNSPQAPAEYGVLARQFNKKSNHLPTRQLITEMGQSLIHLTPCFMMSPLSVAQFLPADFSAFDLVIFDEASQITVWDAVGSIARGKNVIIVGDPKQMPPTNFFSKGGGEDISDEDDLESILDQALSARLPHHRLTGHYRSKHESLIAFSNSHYYENSLVTFPSAETKASAVKMHRVDGLYSKGKNRNNIIEANEVADFIVKRLKEKNQKLSFGVVTLNSEQQRCIEDALDDKRRLNPEIEKFFQGSKKYDPIFVKNLESVQGDERDVIILSLGYGPTEPQAKTMSMNFGPLNKQGGERRLNVAVTRATTEVHVFSSFDSSMIDLSRTSALAVKHLKYFLEFAEKGPIALPETASADFGIDQFDSYFEETVAYALRAKGWVVQTQVGVGKFRIDMGIVHPEKPGVFLAGIECDGATYHSSPAARDRDRVRHIILENLGWKLLRIWSTDYFIDAETIMEKVDGQLREMQETELEDEKDSVNEYDDIFEVEVNESDSIDPTKYFDEDYKTTLEKLAKELLVEKNGITMQELASDIGYKHNLARTTKKQLDHIESIVKPWAGLAVHNSKDVTVWYSPNDVVDIIEWRGVDAFGTPRDWTSVAYPERLGLAKYAIEKAPNDPVDFIFNEFRLSRRTKSTSAKFESWVEAYNLNNKNTEL